MTKKDTNSTTNLNLHQKIQLIQSEIKELTRKEKNLSQHYSFFNELQVLQLLKPLLAKQQVTILLSDDDSKEFTCEQVGKMYLVKYGKKCLLTDSSNPSDQLTFAFWAIGQNNDPAKAKGSAETYAVKYFLTKLFLIPVEDEEDSDYLKKETTAGVKDKGNEEDHSIPKKITDSVVKPPPNKKSFAPQVTATISNIIGKLDKNHNQYLLLETEQLSNNIFVFAYKVAESRWSELTVGTSYRFSLEESNQGWWILTDFVRE